LPDLSLLLNANSDLLPITGSVMGFQPSHVGFPASLSSCLPALPCRFGLDLLSTGLRIPQALRYVEGFFFSQAKPESERRDGFLPIPSMGWVSTASSLMNLLATHQIISLQAAYLVIPTQCVGRYGTIH
jgi:hypothetical protein